MAEIRLRQVAGGIGCGLYVGLTADNQAYKKILINDSGQFKVDNLYGNKSHLLANYKEEAALNKTFEYNVLKVAKNAQVFPYSIHGKTLVNSTTGTVYGNRVAILFGGKMSVEVDFFIKKNAPWA